LVQTFRYNEEVSPSAPALRLRLNGFDVDLIVDTGMAGGVIIPFPLFQSLGFTKKLIPDEYYAVMPDKRSLPIYTAYTNGFLGSKELWLDVHSSPAIEKRLAGRRLLNQMKLELDGPKGIARVHEPR
jgi:hypothetical protein